MNKMKLILLSFITLICLTLSACSSSDGFLITFNSEGGSTIAHQSVQENDLITRPDDPIKPGYQFEYWVYDGFTYTFRNGVTEDMELTAVWSAKDVYTVSFYTGSSYEISSQQVYKGEYAVKPTNPTKVDNEFVEWNLDGSKFDFSNPITENVTLVASWSEILYKYYTVTFENTEISAVQIKEGNYVTQPADPEKINNDFLGWEVDGQPYYFDTPITSNTVIKAIWQEQAFEGRNYTVSTTSEWSAIAKTLTPGDVVTFKNGTYSGSLTRIESYVQGTSTQRITIQTESNDGVIISDRGQWQIHGSYITISGFTFKDGYASSSSGALVIYGNNVRLTNITMDAFDNPGTADDDFATASKTGYVSVQDGAMFAEIDHCTFINKSAQGCLLLVDKNNYDGPTYAHIHDNYFGNFQNAAGLGNEYETIRVGISTMSQTDSYTIIENNIFEDCDGETELISIKSCKNVVRGNLILNCSGAITLRHGNTCLVEDNIILNEEGKEDTNGIRVFDGYHVIRNNYISGIISNGSTFYGGIVIHNGNNEVGKDGNSLSGQWTANNLLIQNNTFVDNDVNICLGDSRYEVAPGNLNFENNLVYSSTGNAIRQYSTLNDSYSQKSVIATNVTYTNEYYFAEGLGLVDETTPSGINFSTDLSGAGLTTLENGLKYSSLAGASNLVLADKEEARPQNEITEACNLSIADYEASFEDWPFKAIYVDIPEPNDILSDYTGVYLEDDLSDWKATSSLDTTTFENKSVLKIEGGTDTTSNSISVGELSGYVAVSFDVFFDDVDKAVFGLKLYNGGTSSTNEVARIKIEDSLFKFQYQTGVLSSGTLKTEYLSYSTLESKKWYNITVVFVTELDSSVTMKANIYINGELQNDAPVLTVRSSDTITHAAFFTDSGQQANTIYVDNFYVVNREINF